MSSIGMMCPFAWAEDTKLPVLVAMVTWVEGL